MLEKGLVIKNDLEGIQVQMLPAGDCGSCNACFQDSDKSQVILFSEKMSVKPGTMVEIEIKSGFALKSAFLLFLLPILMVIFGYYFSINFITIPPLPEDYSGILGGIMALICTYCGIYLYDRYLRKSQIKNDIRIVRVLN